MPQLLHVGYIKYQLLASNSVVHMQFQAGMLTPIVIGFEMKWKAQAFKWT